MERKQYYVDDLKTIKKIMEGSSRFLSLSGLSGIFSGTAALIGGTVAFILISRNDLYSMNKINNFSVSAINNVGGPLLADAAIVLLIAITFSLIFSYRKSLRLQQKFWTPVSKNLLINLFVPLVTGGLFIIIFYIKSQWQFIIPSMLIFYGLALVNAGKFTYNEVFYLGIAEILLGLASAMLPGYSLILWCTGFGILHIGYGYFMYRKYEV